MHATYDPASRLTAHSAAAGAHGALAVLTSALVDTGLVYVLSSEDAARHDVVRPSHQHTN